MTRSEVVDQVAKRAGLSRREASDAVEALLGVIGDELAAGGDVTFSGFGKFHVVTRGAREGRNPRTGERMRIAAATVPRFSPGAALRKAVSG